MSISQLGTSFVLGLLTALTSACVISIYPSFLSFLANNNDSSKKPHYWLYGLLVMLGVMTTMSVVGLVFTTILSISLTSVISILNPIAFIIMGIIGILLIINFDFAKVFKTYNVPRVKSKKLSSYLFGLLFGIIVLPCNPGFLIAMFAKSFLVASPILNITSFIMFSIGMGLPLLILSLLSTTFASKTSLFFAKHSAKINRVAGAIILVIALYYLFGIFF